MYVNNISMALNEPSITLLLDSSGETLSNPYEIIADKFPNFYRKGKLLPPAITLNLQCFFFLDFFVRDWTLLFAKNLTQKFDPKIIAENLKGLSKYKS